MPLTKDSADQESASRVVLAHDYLTQRGGAERVALHLTDIFPSAPLYTSLYSPEKTYERFAEVDVRTSYLQRAAPLRRDPRLALPLLARAWSTTRLPPAEVVLASSSGWAHGVPTPAGGRKVVYCHNPPRWLHQPADYLSTATERAGMRALRQRLTLWDQAAAQSADLYIANSTSVAARIERVYGREAAVAFPPVMIDAQGAQEPVDGLGPDFFLTVARGRAYKNVDAVSSGVEAFRGGQLAIVGSEAPASGGRSHERWCGTVTDGQLRWLYANARALISVSYEDFGLTPLEANAFGTPSVVLRAGGFLDSTDHGVSGWFVETPYAAAVTEALRALPDFDPHEVRRHADGFSVRAFSQRMQELVLQESRA